MDFVTLRIKVKEEAEKRGFTDWEITFSGSQGTELMVRDGQVDHFENSIQHVLPLEEMLMEKQVIPILKK